MGIGGNNIDADLVRFDIYILTLRAECMKHSMNRVVAGAFKPDPLVQIHIQNDWLVAEVSPAGTRINHALAEAISPGVTCAAFGCDDEAVAPEAENGAVMLS
jgi:hypothetical protein